MCVHAHACLCGCIYNVFVCCLACKNVCVCIIFCLVPFLMFEWEFLHGRSGPHSPKKTSPKRGVLPGLIS